MKERTGIACRASWPSATCTILKAGYETPRFRKVDAIVCTLYDAADMVDWVRAQQWEWATTCKPSSPSEAGGTCASKADQSLSLHYQSVIHENKPGGQGKGSGAT
jgi:hypothetical protein